MYIVQESKNVKRYMVKGLLPSCPPLRCHLPRTLNPPVGHCVWFPHIFEISVDLEEKHSFDVNPEKECIY